MAFPLLPSYLLSALMAWSEDEAHVVERAWRIVEGFELDIATLGSLPHEIVAKE